MVPSPPSPSGSVVPCWVRASGKAEGKAVEIAVRAVYGLGEAVAL